MNNQIQKPVPSMVAEAASSLPHAPNGAAAPASNANAIMESVLLRGDLSKLSSAERNAYYMETCRSLRLNPLTRPFEYITLNGKLQLYAKRDCTDQLRQIRGISIEIVSRELDEDGLMTVWARATEASGRKDEDFGVVSIGPLKGEVRANAILKAVTKAKRRVTLSICGLGLLDETEVTDIPGAKVDFDATDNDGDQHPWGRDGYGNGKSITQPGEYNPEPGQPSHKELKKSPSYKQDWAESATQARRDAEEAAWQQREDELAEEIDCLQSPSELDEWEHSNRRHIDELPQDRKARTVKRMDQRLIRLANDVRRQP
jgi:hypothetical protein